MIWPFRKRKSEPVASKGSFMHEVGTHQCKCGCVIPIEVAVVLRNVESSRFVGMKPVEVLLNHLPCPNCDRSFAIKVHPGR